MGGERVRMRAITGQFYDRRRLYIGDTFDAHPDEVAELIALNLAVRAMNSEGPPTAAAAAAEPLKSPRKYRRRDMQPGD
jgi:hypothetical protein